MPVVFDVAIAGVVVVRARSGARCLALFRLMNRRGGAGSWSRSVRWRGSVDGAFLTSFLHAVPRVWIRKVVIGNAFR